MTARLGFETDGDWELELICDGVGFPFDAGFAVRLATVMERGDAKRRRIVKEFGGGEDARGLEERKSFAAGTESERGVEFQVGDEIGHALLRENSFEAFGHE